MRWKVPPAPTDWLLAATVGLIQLVGGHGANANQSDVTVLDGFGYLLLAVGPAALVVRRGYPMPVFLVTLAAAIGYVARGYGYGPIFLSLVVGFLTAAVDGSRWRSYPLVPAGYLLLVWPVPVLIGRPPPSWWQALGIAAWLLVLVSIAEGVRQRRAVVQARRQRAEAHQRRRASEERLAIARELHDVLAHSLSLINVQSAVALELLDRKPEQAGVALAAIKSASRDALGEVHALLDSIRSGADPAPTTPAPTVADLDAVVARARSAGIEVHTTIDGAVRRLPTVVDVAAARIVQESLTNVARHAPGASATVAVRYAPDALRIRVDDDGTDGPAGTGGSGIEGMRERARALGGEVVAGPRRGGGFRVEAALPLGDRP